MVQQKTNPMARLSMIHPCYLKRERESDGETDRERGRYYGGIKEWEMKTQRVRKKERKSVKEESVEGGQKGEERSVIWTLCQSNRLAHWVKWYMTGTGPPHMHTRAQSRPHYGSITLSSMCATIHHHLDYISHTHTNSGTCMLTPIYCTLYYTHTQLELQLYSVSLRVCV